MDLPLVGYSFTWSRSRERVNAVEERLDRALVNQGWLNLLPSATLTNLLAAYFNHNMILLQCNSGHRIRATISFKFENSWLREGDIEEVVLNGWCRRENEKVMNRIASCASELTSWNKRKYSKQKDAKAGYLASMELYRGGHDTVSLMHYLED